MLPLRPPVRRLSVAPRTVCRPQALTDTSVSRSRNIAHQAEALTSSSSASQLGPMERCFHVKSCWVHCLRFLSLRLVTTLSLSTRTPFFTCTSPSEWAHGVVGSEAVESGGRAGPPPLHFPSISEILVCHTCCFQANFPNMNDSCNLWAMWR